MPVTRRHGSRAHWPPDEVVYADGSEVALDSVGAQDGDFAYLWADGTGEAPGGTDAQAFEVVYGGDQVTRGGDPVVWTG